jgi:hypothetical protein
VGIDTTVVFGAINYVESSLTSEPYARSLSASDVHEFFGLLSGFPGGLDDWLSG